MMSVRQYVATCKITSLYVQWLLCMTPWLTDKHHIHRHHLNSFCMWLAQPALVNGAKKYWAFCSEHLKQTWTLLCSYFGMCAQVDTMIRDQCWRRVFVTIPTSLPFISITPALWARLASMTTVKGIFLWPSRKAKVMILVLQVIMQI